MKKINGGIDRLFGNPKLMRACRAAFFISIIVVIVADCMEIIKNTRDIDVYLNAARQIRGGQDIYAAPVSEHRLYYVYLPLFAVLLTPLTLIPREIAIVFWTISSVILIGWIIYAFYELITGESLSETNVKTRWTIIFFSLALSLDSILPHLKHGQTNILITALAILAIRVIERRKSAAGGVIFGIAAVIKIIVFPGIAWFFFQRKFKVVAGVLAGAFAGLLLPGFVVGWATNFRYIEYWVEKIVLHADLRNHFVPFMNNVSLQAVMYRLFSETPAYEYRGTQYYLTIFPVADSALRHAAIFIVFAVVAAPLVYLIKYRKSSRLISHWGGVALSFAVAPLFTTVAEKYHFVLLLPAYVYIVYIWHVVKLRDNLFRALVFASFAAMTLTAKFFCGEFLNKVLFALACVSWAAILLAAAIFRASSCLKNQDSESLN